MSEKRKRTNSSEPHGLNRFTGFWMRAVSVDMSMVSIILVLLLLLGLVCVLAQEWGGNPFTATLWSLACFGAGSLIGFLFGIPRVLQQDGVAPTTQVSNATAGGGGALNQNAVYSIKVNTNLEQISDWLTKIFVGLGLIQLQRVPQHLDRAATYVAYGLGGGTKFFAGGLIVYFTVLGFLGFYLVTRLYIAGALSRADQDANQKLDQDRRKVQNIDLRLDAGVRSLGDTDRAAAKNVISASSANNLSFEEMAVRAKAMLSLGKYDQAVRLYRDLVANAPEDIRFRFEYGVALFYSGAKLDAYQQMQEAYRRITADTDSALKKNIYRSLTFQALYLPPPEGFEDAIKYGSEYVEDTYTVPDPAIWTNLAAAYGQKAAWYATQPNPDAKTSSEIRESALNAVRKAASLGNRWKQRLLELMVKGFPNKSSDDNDLEFFEMDNEFREAVGLSAR